MVNWPRLPWFGPQEDYGGGRSRLRDFPRPVRTSARPADDFWDDELEDNPDAQPAAAAVETASGGGQSTPAAPGQNPSPEAQALLKDRAMAAEAPQRWRPDIDPNSADFAAVLEDFGSMLADPRTTIRDILVENFAPHERNLLLPTDRLANPTLHAIQVEDRTRYAELLDSERFGREWKRKADLAFKLTLAYFGLPVAPLRAGLAQQFPGFGDESDPEDGLLEAGDDDEPEGGRLRFLNSYRFRSHEHDILREPDNVLERYYAFHDLRKVGPARRMLERTKGHSIPTSSPSFPTLSLRGGGGSDSDSDSYAEMADAGADSDSDTLDFKQGQEAFGELSIRGGGHLRQLGRVFGKIQANSSGLSSHVAFTSSDAHLDLLQSALGGEKLSHNDFWLPLYGYQGIVWFRLGYLNTFVDAVDRLLCLDNRSGVSYSLYLLDRAKDYTLEEEQAQFLADGDRGVTVWAKGPGDYSNDAFAHAWVISKLDKLGHSAAADGHKALHDKVLFVAGPDDPIPWEWEPGLKHPRVVKFVLEWEKAPSLNRPDVAYVRLPESSWASYSNYFAPWMAQACRVLAAGRIPGRPGRPAIPDAFFALKTTDEGTNSGPASYGGLSFPPSLWSDISDKYAMKGLETRVLVAKMPHNKASGRFHLFLPGYGRPYGSKDQFIMHGHLDKRAFVKKTILNLLKDSMSPGDFNDKLKAVEVHLPGDGFFTISDDEAGHGLVVSRESLERGQVDELVDRLKQWKEWLEARDVVPPSKSGLAMFPQFITLRPVFKTYLIHDGARDSDGENNEAVSWKPDIDSLTTFRQKVYRLWSGEGGDLSKDTWISITQLSPEADFLTGEYQHYDVNKPNFLIGPRTSDVEWREIVKMIVSPDIIVYHADERSAPVFKQNNAEQPFGYRDIYETNHSILYQGLGNVPHPIQLRYEDFQARYKDFQVYGADLIPSLKTLQPGDKQPAAPTLADGKEKFKLVIPRHAAAAPATTVPTANPRWRRPAPVFEPRPQTEAQRAMKIRERSYAHPLSVQSERSIPIHAPPLEALLNTGHDSLPVVSTAVLTSTETRRLQKDVFEMRNLLLKRSQKCPYAGCEAVYPYNRPEAMQQHLRDAHIGDQCNFCNHILYRHWPPEERYRHFVKEHSKLLSSLQTHPRDLAAQAPAQSAEPPAGPDPRETKWKFCSRCGRDHTVLDSLQDRAQHDKVCVPGTGKIGAHWSFCETCGDAVDGKAHGHKHGHAAEGPYCQNCALPLVLFSEAYRVKHENFCKQRGREEFKYCPWCGVSLPHDLEDCKSHVESCKEKPSPDALGPTDPYEKPRRVNLENYQPEADLGNLFDISGNPPPIPLAATKGSNATKYTRAPPSVSGFKMPNKGVGSARESVGAMSIFGPAKENRNQAPPLLSPRVPDLEELGHPEATIAPTRREDFVDPFYISSPEPKDNTWHDPFFIHSPRDAKKIPFAKKTPITESKTSVTASRKTPIKETRQTPVKGTNKRKLDATASGAAPTKKARATSNKAAPETSGMVTRSRKK